MKIENLALSEFKTEGVFTVVLTRQMVKSGVESGVESGEETKAHIENNLGNVLNKTEWAILELIYCRSVTMVSY